MQELFGIIFLGQYYYYIVIIINFKFVMLLIKWVFWGGFICVIMLRLKSYNLFNIVVVNFNILIDFYIYF